jgi:hypothetical protein
LIIKVCKLMLISPFICLFGKEQYIRKESDDVNMIVF